jgi:protein phosphatase
MEAPFRSGDGRGYFMTQFSVLTDVGIRRNRNEDAFFCSAQHGLYVVADGVGGLPSGDEASRLAAEVFEVNAPRLASLAETYAGTPGRVTGARILQALEEVCQEANRMVYAMACRQDQIGSSTTIAACLVAGDAAFLVHVGDSRIYLARESVLFPLTSDHSVVGELVRLGVITNAEARRHPRRNLITQAVGAQPSCKPEVQVVQLLAGDRLILATDGLTDMVDDDEIAILATRRDVTSAVQEMVLAALDNGGRDNVTVALVDPAVPVRFETTVRRAA